MIKRKLSGRILGITLICFLAAGPSLAQKNETQLRTVHGAVIDKSDAPVSGSVVFLKNTRTNTVRSYITDEQGNYRFSGLDPNADYDVHAEKDGAKSPSHTVSSFDGRKDIVLNLRLGEKKD